MDKRISVLIFSCILLLWTAFGDETITETTTNKVTSPTTAPSNSSPTVVPNPSSTYETVKSVTATFTATASVKPSSEPGSSPDDDSTNSTNITSRPAPTTEVTKKQTDTLTTQNTASTSKNTEDSSKDSSTSSPASTATLTQPSALTEAPPGSKGNLNEEEKSKETSEKRYLWILLPALCVLLAATIYFKFKCKKVQHRPEMTDNGTENASFQRTDSNKDGVMLLGVNKTTSGEENVIVFDGK